MQQLLFNLCNAPCLGPVENAFAVAEEFLAPFAAVTRSPGRLIAAVPGTGEPVLLEAHLDEVGFTVTHVHPNGFLTVAPVGSVDSRILAGTPVTVLGQRLVPGVFTSVPPHLSSGSKVAAFNDLKIDIGKADANLVRPGDFAVFCAPAAALAGSCVTAKALDNRSGVAAVLLAAQKAAAQKGGRPVTVLLTNGEELGCRGAKTGGFALLGKVGCAVSVDVSFGNFPGCEPEHTAVLGTGAMVGVSPVLSGRVTAALKQLAKQNNIPFTLEVMGSNTSTNADVLSVTGGGIAAGLVSIPLRNMHTPCEVINLNDLAAVANLLAQFCKEGC